MIAVDEFLRRYPPLDELPDDELEAVTDSLQIEFFEAGAEILRQGGESASFLYAVRTGAIELLDEGNSSTCSSRVRRSVTPYSPPGSAPPSPSELRRTRSAM